MNASHLPNVHFENMMATQKGPFQGSEMDTCVEGENTANIYDTNFYLTPLQLPDARQQDASGHDCTHLNLVPAVQLITHT